MAPIDGGCGIVKASFIEILSIKTWVATCAVSVFDQICPSSYRLPPFRNPSNHLGELLEPFEDHPPALTHEWPVSRAAHYRTKRNRPIV
jgi:hypothetical protein